MNSVGFALMALGYFTGNVASNGLILHKPWEEALIVGAISTLFWVIFYGGYLFFSRKKP